MIEVQYRNAVAQDSHAVKLIVLLGLIMKLKIPKKVNITHLPLRATAMAPAATELEVVRPRFATNNVPLVPVHLTAGKGNGC